MDEHELCRCEKDFAGALKIAINDYSTGETGIRKLTS
jgi:hypothetical protein